MAYTPVEIRHVRLPRGLLGYGRRTVDKLLADVTDSFETVWRDRADLADKVEQLESDLVRYRELEQLLHTTLVSAERAAHDLREQARREAQTIVDEARAESRTITREARSERELIASESRRIRTLLQAALAAVDEADDHEGEDGQEHSEAA
jgi:cell division initiation protein